MHIVGGDIFAGAAGEEFVFHTRAGAGSDFLQITDRDAGLLQWGRGITFMAGTGNVGPIPSPLASYGVNIGTSIETSIGCLLRLNLDI